MRTYDSSTHEAEADAGEFQHESGPQSEFLSQKMKQNSNNSKNPYSGRCLYQLWFNSWKIRIKF